MMGIEIGKFQLEDRGFSRTASRSGESGRRRHHHHLENTKSSDIIKDTF